ncbi:hypothetical protein B0H16DRAFT_1815801 [Mycena metata]|uniref:Uncharacterized protein n=2 Tax=Mycena metata TaxID=1033252 RepID=A0AAD7MDJ9_9AGAR|nr:hypothetical protein B0H16DRAFT_1815801 [Mycena metata]
MNTPAFNFPSSDQMVPHGATTFTSLSPSAHGSLTASSNMPAPYSSDPFLNVPELVLSPLFIDNLAKDFDLDIVQRNYLHTCAQLGSVDGGLTKADLATRLYHLAVFLNHANAMKQAAPQGNIDSLTHLLEDLRVRLDDGYTFTREQMRNIRTQAQDTIYEATRTSFMTMHTDVMNKLKDARVTLKLNSVFGNPSREKALMSVVKKTCSSVRNSLRQDLRNGICGDSPSMLAEFTYASATKFKRGGPGLGLDIGFTIHVALLRRFARENPSTIGVEEVEDDDTTEDIGSSPAPPTKKRKIAATSHGGGRIPKGKDFWSQVDKFFTQKIVEFGSKNLQGAGWKEYTSETIQMDEHLFPSHDETEEPMSDVPAASVSSSTTANLNAGGSRGSNLLRHM